MKAQIESPVRCKNQADYQSTFMQMARIIQDILTASDENELRNNLLYTFKLGKMSHFQYGFGSNHCWVKQTESDDRMIFVEF